MSRHDTDRLVRRPQLDSPLPPTGRAARLWRSKPLGLWADTWRRLRRNKLALVGLGIITVFMVVGLSEVVANLANTLRSPPTIPTP